MAAIDLKECTIKFFDGTLGTIAMESTPSDSDITLTAISKHIGSDKISCIFADPGSASATLAVAVTGRLITVTLATDATSAITSTAALVKTAIEANATANALVTVALETAGTGIVEAIAETTLDGQQSLEIVFGEGNFTYTEHNPVEFKKNRGVLHSVRNADEEPVDLSCDALYEYFESVAASTTPTPRDCIKQENEASAWVTTADDSCQPYCIDVELWNAPVCTAIEDEILMFEEAYFETFDFNVQDATINFAGRCNRTAPVASRVLAAAIG